MDYQRLEAAVNVVFRDHPLTLLCPYDAGALPRPLVDIGRQTHDFVLDDRGRRPNEDFADPAAVLLGLATVTPPPAGALTLRCDRPVDLARARRFVRDHGARAGLDPDAVDDVTLAVTEILTNALTHGHPPRRLHLYDAGATWICHVHDGGRGPDDPFAGFAPGDADRPRLRPVAGSAAVRRGGRGRGRDRRAQYPARATRHQR